MADQTGYPDHADGGRRPQRAVPDYDLPDALTLEEPQQYRALFEDTRQAIITLLSERAATVSELAQVLDRPKGTVGHHVQVLASAGLVHVVRTEKVRALEAKYWGRTARVFYYQTLEAGTAQRLLERSAAEVGRVEASGQGEKIVMDVNRRDVRVPAERAREFRDRLADLLLEFADEPRAGDTTYAMVFGIFPSSLDVLPERAGEGS
ncbi:winged helix-turn-helix transcriptional regulator [Ornithinimicrobium ciconiae]|uniref:Winged helix-turn-helix transcriptional regulator n=1 Tax=Ornithinimicrobium ciconiae TaxID=2594265 RepID=A0A516G825_9MICO|nr:winged helix-turn-helix domain-containing protein [Ornithinimicrobium ciconiae]QDO87686.1 winged helix-turn-helix transcriptional regulator [Ornithinimicrobium ciconiae]